MPKTSKRIWRGDANFYKLMVSRHSDTWELLKNIVDLTGWKDPNIFEVGGGYGFVSDWTKGKYTCVELNEGITGRGHKRYPTAEFIVDDFQKMDVRPMCKDPGYDIFLAASVIEHCPGYQAFILKALDVQPRLTIITFFRTLMGDEDGWNRIESPEVTFWLNSYSAGCLQSWLRGIGVSYALFTQIRSDSFDVRNVFLLIDNRNELGEEFWKKVESLENIRRGYGEWACGELKEKKEAQRRKYSRKGKADAKAEEAGL